MNAATLGTVLNAVTLLVAAPTGIKLARLAWRLHRRGVETRWPTVGITVMTVVACAGPAAQLAGTPWPHWANFATVAVLLAMSAGIWWARRDRIRSALRGGDQ